MAAIRVLLSSETAPARRALLYGSLSGEAYAFIRLHKEVAMSLALEVVEMLGQTITKVVPITIVLALVFSVLTHFWACNPGTPWWRKQELLTDICYWFFVPLFARVLRIGLLVVGAGVAVFEAEFADGVEIFEGEAGRVEAGVAIGAARVLAMRFQTLAHGCGDDLRAIAIDVGLDASRRGWNGGSQQILEYPAATNHG